MKTAVSIPNELFESADGLAWRLGEYLGEHWGEGIPDRLDEVHGAEEEDNPAPVPARLQRSSLSEDEW